MLSPSRSPVKQRTAAQRTAALLIDVLLIDVLLIDVDLRVGFVYPLASPGRRMPQDITAPILKNVHLGHDSFLIEFEAPAMAAETRPGQFFMIGLPDRDVLLRRPFSVCGLPGTFSEGASGALQVLYKVVGAGTRRLASLRAGAELNVLGPLGRGFTRPEGEGVRAVFVAGGIGSAPFPALAAALVESGIVPSMLYGARTAGDLPLLEWFRGHCERLVVTTNDGSLGERGLVTDPLADMLGDPSGRNTLLYACGPEPMLRAVARLAVAAGVDCELSLEANMACGFGVCLGCVVPVRSGDSATPSYERVCVEGPVMRAERLRW